MRWRSARAGLLKHLAWYIYVVSFPRGKLHVQTPRANSTWKLHVQTPRTEPDSLTEWLNNSLTDSLTASDRRLTHWLTSWLSHWLACWPTDRLTYSPTHLLTHRLTALTAYIVILMVYLKLDSYFTTDFYFRIPYNYINKLMIFSFLWYNGNFCLYC